ncbi:flagellar basal body L-ring protein FlgH [Thiomicrorhabdus sp. zzn3]|uniref:flagellar basal body L-ring protein FlgH n=1 Tax=Thiomicrorhabdus sp. zzn3 TaxID=3039775 RepID=UPI0024372AD4|nr:flagellar basal body L-ring protein FlgH [Thiomicrorhabdus sp. zzn3]MDG6777600.1 flagellar basal body L-ring protein FlgH [Thiomicrorhabdus sp. zzn3]
MNVLRHTSKISTGLFVFTVALLSGCSSTPERVQQMSFEPNYPLNIPQQTQPNNGSLYQTGAMTLFDDSRAHRVGDIITITLTEKFDAKKKDEAKYNKSNSQDFGVSTPLNVFGRSAGQVASELGTLGVGYGSTGSFQGKSDVKQNSSLTGAIAVTVVEVIPNGNLVVRGEKRLAIHEGDEVIQFAGIIRPQDIRPDNSIDSTKVADVRLVYKDVGMSGDTGRPSALTQWMNKYWPI